MTFFLILSLLLLGIIYLYYQRSKYWERRDVNGPKSLPFIGNLWQLGKSNTKPWPFKYREWTQKYGSYYGLQRGWLNFLVISDHQMAREVMNDKFEYFHERDLAPIIGNVDKDPFQHVFTSRGLRWKRLRALTTTVFTVNNLKRVLPTVDFCASETTRLIEKHADGLDFNIHDYFYEYTMDVICKIGLGIKDCRQFDNKFTKMIKKMLHDIEDTFSYISWIVPYLGSYLRVVQLGSAVLGDWNFVNMIKMLKNNIDERKKMRGEGICEETSADFIDLFLDAQIEDMNEVVTETAGVYNRTNAPHIVKKLTNEELVAQCLLFLFAGFDTTANTLAFTSYYLAKYPHIQDKLRKEMEEICVKPNPSYDELNRMKYADAIMKEALRFHPLGAMVCGRKAVEDTQLGDLLIEKGTDVVLDILSLHFDRKIWGEDADEFRPERWLETDVPQNASYSFGAGPRICAGMRLAYLEQKMLLTYLMREYRLLPGNEMELKISGFVMHPEKVMVRLEYLK